MEDIISFERSMALSQMESTPNVSKKLVIFSDYGLDDAVALIYILQNRSGYELIDIVPVGGNVHPRTALINARRLLCEAEREGISISGVKIVDCEEYYQEWCVLPHIHGADGMGDILSEFDRSPVEEVPFEPWAASLEEGYRILSLGPCTMVRRAIGYSVNNPGGRITIKGGCISETPNYKGKEFNDGLDHNAFIWTLRRPHSLVALDTCRVPAFNLAGARKTGNTLFNRLINRSIELSEARHPDNCYIYDYIAAVALIHPELFETENIYLPEICRDMTLLRLKDELKDRRDLL